MFLSEVLLFLWTCFVEFTKSYKNSLQFFKNFSTYFINVMILFFNLSVNMNVNFQILMMYLLFKNLPKGWRLKNNVFIMINCMIKKILRTIVFGFWSPSS